MLKNPNNHPSLPKKCTTNTTKLSFSTQTKLDILKDTSLDPNYNEIEQFVLDLIHEGYDLIDTLILARETFNTDRLDSYLYEMRDKGLI